MGTTLCQVAWHQGHSVPLVFKSGPQTVQRIWELAQTALPFIATVWEGSIVKLHIRGLVSVCCVLVYFNTHHSRLTYF